MSGCEILFCPPADLRAGIEVLHAGLSADQQAALLATLDQLSPPPPKTFEGFLVAKNGSELLAACWVQLVAGNSANFWPPCFQSPAARELMLAAESFLVEKRVDFAQMVIASEVEIAVNLLALAGFHKLVELEYLCLDKKNFTEQVAEYRLVFEPDAPRNPMRLQNLLLETYRQTLDCPELNGLRDIADVLQGYQQQGNYRPEQWYYAKSGSTDVGVLILAEYPATGIWELVYMGVVPGARGNRYGAEIVGHAIRQAILHSANKLVLAADVRNAPALAMYRSVGFEYWDRRTVYSRQVLT